jgi:hypothetical protein
MLSSVSGIVQLACKDRLDMGQWRLGYYRVIPTIFMNTATIDAHIKDIIESLANPNLLTGNERGVISYFEFASVLHQEARVRSLATEEKIRMLVDFSTNEQDCDQTEFPDEIKPLTVSTKT